jgi:signal transduction histidine kinase
MTFPSQDRIQFDKSVMIMARAKVYVLVRLIIDIILLVFILLQAAGQTRQFVVAIVLVADMLGLALYRLSVRRWPTASTYTQLILATLLLIAFDFAWGSVTFMPWFLTIPLSIAGGLIVTRSGFNGLVTMSIYAIFGLYIGLILLGRIPLPLDMPANLLVMMSSALAVVLLIINALMESLVVYFYQTEAALLQTRAQLLYTLQELEQSRNLLSQVQNQTRRVARLSTVGQIAEQLSKSLRGPLERIDSILRKPEEIQKNPRIIKQLRQQVRAALRMTEGLKEYTQLTDLHIKTVNLDDILAKELTQTYIPKRITLEVKQPPVFPPIQADPDKVRLVVHHLLHNALQVSRTNGGEVTITLGSRPDGVTLAIKDSGPGIAPEEIQAIFEPLYTTQPQGFGLGLAIAQRVVEMHGGYIEVESEPGRGATFTLFLPRLPQTRAETSVASSEQ